MSSEESFNAVIELHCQRLIYLWGKSDASRRALEERGPALVVAASAPAITSRNNKSSCCCYCYGGREADSESNCAIPSAMRFLYNTEKRKYMENTEEATTRAEQEEQQQEHHQKQQQEHHHQQQHHQHQQQQQHHHQQPQNYHQEFDGSMNCKTSSKRLIDEQKQNKTRLVAAAGVTVSTTSSAPAELDESMEDDQMSLLSEVNDFDSFVLLW